VSGAIFAVVVGLAAQQTLGNLIAGVVLISARPFRTGVVYLVYGPDPNPPTGGYDDAKQQLPQE